ncbi:MAG: type III-A CRISPR-associated protein Csm2, partial [Bacteroidales bacterium]|nr:type III-A CRISPR-associated protein Csm2 [Bacteroidales bacterium]
DALSYTQLRNILQEVKQNEKNPVVIIPKLAYMEARQEKTKQKELVRFIRELLVKSIKEKKTSIFLEYMNTLVAYHKYYSTK